MGFVSVKSPATTANLGPGFDTLGVALRLYNTIEMSDDEKSGLLIEVEGEGADETPRDESNVVYQAADLVFKRVGYQPRGLRIHLVNEVPFARGLGSSAAAIVGGVVAANALSGGRLGEREMLHIAYELEGHPDNVVPAALGGFIITTVTSAGAVEYIKVLPSPTIRAVAVIPTFELKTKDARSVLPETFDFRDVVYNVSHASLFVAAFITGNFSSLRYAMEDKVHQPYREALIPGMKRVFEAAMRAGAQSVSISGSGPTIIAFVNSRDDQVGRAMSEAWLAEGIDSACLPVELDTQGTRILEAKT
jgi:homoserine kinase